MPKISALPPMTTPAADDPAPVVDDSAGTTKKTTLGQIRDWLYSLVDIPAGPASPVTRDSEHLFDHVASGIVITGDSYGSNRNASMTAGIVYINGRRISISSVSARTYTASRDTYIDILDNLDGTGTVVYTEVTNNNASPALASNSLRVGIVVTGASNIANVGSINQGEFNKLLPIASSIPYTFNDSLGNIICNRDPMRRIIGYKQITTGASTASASATLVTGLTAICKPASNRPISIELSAPGLYNSTASARADVTIWDGTVGSGTQIGMAWGGQALGSGTWGAKAEAYQNPSGTKTYNIGLHSGSGGGTSTLAAFSTSPAFLIIRQG